MRRDLSGPDFNEFTLCICLWYPAIQYVANRDHKLNERLFKYAMAGENQLRVKNSSFVNSVMIVSLGSIEIPLLLLEAGRDDVPAEEVHKNYTKLLPLLF